MPGPAGMNILWAMLSASISGATWALADKSNALCTLASRPDSVSARAFWPLPRNAAISSASVASSMALGFVNIRPSRPAMRHRFDLPSCIASRSKCVAMTSRIRSAVLRFTSSSSAISSRLMPSTCSAKACAKTNKRSNFAMRGDIQMVPQCFELYVPWKLLLPPDYISLNTAISAQLGTSITVA